jgi:hypothetical protein
MEWPPSQAQISPSSFFEEQSVCGEEGDGGHYENNEVSQSTIRVRDAEWQSVGGSQSKGRSVDEAELHRFTLLLAITASGHSSFTFRRVNRSTRCSRSDPLSPILCSCKLACSSSAEAEALFELFEA